MDFEHNRFEQIFQMFSREYKYVREKDDII